MRGRLVYDFSTCGPSHTVWPGACLLDGVSSYGTRWDSSPRANPSIIFDCAADIAPTHSVLLLTSVTDGWIVRERGVAFKVYLWHVHSYGTYGWGGTAVTSMNSATRYSLTRGFANTTRKAVLLPCKLNYCTCWSICILLEMNILKEEVYGWTSLLVNVLNE